MTTILFNRGGYGVPNQAQPDQPLHPQPQPHPQPTSASQTQRRDEATWVDVSKRFPAIQVDEIQVIHTFKVSVNVDPVRLTTTKKTHCGCEDEDEYSEYVSTR